MNSVKCAQCGFVGWSGAESCKMCGSPLVKKSGEDVPARDRYIMQRDLKKGLAVFSLVIGIINLFTLGLLGVGAVLGIVLAVVAMSRAKNHPLVYGGKELATAGLITSVLSLVLMVPIGIVAAIAIPNLLASRRAANEGATIATLRKIHSAEATYQATVGAGEFGTLEELVAESLIDPKVASGHFGYRFNVESTSGVDYESGFEATAVPLSYPNSGRRSFFVDETGVMRAADANGNPATEDDPPLNFDSMEQYRPPERQLGYQPQPVY